MNDLIKGRGSQQNTPNRFSKYETVTEHVEGLDEPLLQEVTTQVFFDYPKNIVNKIESPDVGMQFSVNPYQGCEHGCVYCYARNSHEYWGFSAGLDFESKLIAKPNAPQLLAQAFEHKNWNPAVISLSGNTDCYQPIERTYKLTRQLLEVCLAYKNPVGIITKNQLILRDLDILKQLASHQLVQVYVTITSLDESIRQKLEPRTTTYANRLKVVEQLTQAGIPCGVMVAPIIPGLTNYGIAEVIQAAGKAGAYNAGYTILRLNGKLNALFSDWVHKAYPDAATKILKQTAACHGGQVNDSRYTKRMKGEGKIAETIRNLFVASRNKYMSQQPLYDFNTTAFERPYKVGDQLKLL
ncbi:MAG: PA0069 family radical SAM protein [Bacteroidia bacterium]|jgi:DNA repair photolyase|nr:PA0069 family radical SAM protein [Bacteroidia bacterium]